MIQIQPEMVTVKFEKILPYDRAIELLKLLTKFDYPIRESSTTYADSNAEIKK